MTVRGKPTLLQIVAKVARDPGATEAVIMTAIAVIVLLSLLLF